MGDYSSLISPAPAETNGLEWLGAATGAVIALIVFAVIIGLALAILIIVARCKMFEKAGEKWWKSLIPVYSTWIETKIGGLAWWWLPIFVLVAGLSAGKGTYVFAWTTTLVQFNIIFNISKKFGKSGGFAFLCTILPFVGLPMLGFGSTKYDKNTKVDKNGIFSIEK